VAGTEAMVVVGSRRWRPAARSTASVVAVVVLLSWVAPSASAEVTPPPVAPTLEAGGSADHTVASTTPTTVEVGIPGTGPFGDLVVDDAHARVFVSRGDTIAVFDESAALIASLDGQHGAGAMTIVGGTLFVVQEADGAITAVDTATLTTVGTVASGLGDATDLASSGDQLFVLSTPDSPGWACDRVPWTITRIEVGSWTATELALPLEHGGCPRLVASPTDGGVVFTVGAYRDPVTYWAYSVLGAWNASGSTLVKLAERSEVVNAEVHDLSVASDGTYVDIADNYDVMRVDAQTLERTPVALEVDSVRAVAERPARGGVLAVGSHSYWSDLRVFAGTAPHPLVAELELGRRGVQSGGVAISDDGTEVFGITTDDTLIVLYPFGIPTGGFHPLPPKRILDTRAPGDRPLGHSEARDVQVTGGGGVPAAGVTSVVVNVTVDAPTTPGYLSLSPSGGPAPDVSNLNFVAGQTVPNLVTVPVGTDGKVRIFNSSGTTHVIVDVAGWYDDTGDGQPYHPVEPDRILDTRTGLGGSGPVQAGTPLTVQIHGKGGVPTGATAVAMNITETRPTTASHLTVWPSGLPQPDVSNLNFRGGMTRPNMVIVPIGADGTVKIANAAGGVHVLADVAGWYGPGEGGSRFVPVHPTRLFDTRDHEAPLGAEVTIDLPIGEALPDAATAVVLNVTNVNSTAQGFVTVFPRRGGMPRPEVSNLNFLPGEINPNLVVVRVGEGGVVSFYNPTGFSDVVVDIFGFTTP
jgi:hypothetical protein